MTEMLRQSLSAAIDDEADAFELRRVVDELDRDPELRATWERYHLIGSALRGERRRIRPDMRERIWQALDGVGEGQEPAPADVPRTVAGQPATRTGLRRYAGMAVAASVVFAVAVGSGFFGAGTDDEVPALAGAELTPQAVATGQVAATAGAGRTAAAGRTAGVTAGNVALTGQSPDIPASDLQRAHAYMLHHTQQQAMNQSSVMSLVKLATYEAP